ncbi:MAG: hypothetical protein Q4A92_03150, partial [Corynebacterium sp.]|nr:hypothetical protein [Corynebacterium sp.]
MLASQACQICLTGCGQSENPGYVTAANAQRPVIVQQLSWDFEPGVVTISPAKFGCGLLVRQIVQGWVRLLGKR